MCGIAGVFAYGESAPPVDAPELLRVREHMAARGPDGAGMWISDCRRVGLAHRRLAIIDLSDSGAQPMASADGRTRITFNGEIYNYRELRGELERKGHRFRSTSDTEVLLHLYADRGTDMVRSLRGMFAFALWDDARKGLFLARDPFGIKPLYFSDSGGTLRLASQVKALLAGGAVDTRAEPAGHVGFFIWGHVPDPYTLYKGIRSLGAGSTMWVDTSGRKEHRQFFRIGSELAELRATRPRLAPPEMRERLRVALLDSVRHHLVADVPVGSFLSAGLDSATLTALAREIQAADLHTFTLGFREFVGRPDDEVPLAEEVARRLGTIHQSRRITKDDFAGAYQHLLQAMDQPSTDGVNTYFVSRAAANAGLKVALSGLGGDELFGGYDSFTDIPLLTRWFGPFRATPWLGRGFRYVSAPFVRRFTSPKYAGLLEYGGTYGGAYLLRRGMFMPWELPELLDGDMVRQGWHDLKALPCLAQTTEGIDDAHVKVTALETSWYMRNQLLRDADWASMAHSLEIRVPLVDVDLFRAVTPLLGGRGGAGKAAMAGAPSSPLPEAVLGRNKTGFSVPVREWMLGDNQGRSPDRGLRGWARRVYAEHYGRDARVLALVSDAFGGNGGIALYNRDFLTAVCRHPRVREVVAFPRNLHRRLEEMPGNLQYVTAAAGGKARYLVQLLRYAATRPRLDLIVCGHINLLPLAQAFHCLTGAPVLLEIYGIEAWEKTGSRVANMLAAGVSRVVSISEITRSRFLSWANRHGEAPCVLPNAIHAGNYGAGQKSPELLSRYGLQGATVIMTLGRMLPDDRYKGFDEVLDVLPELIPEIPNIAYLIAGDGPDRARLKEKSERLGVSGRVVFAGAIREEEKADHYRLADAYVMPSYGEGFGFVILEALACGIPVVASKVDGGREAIRDGELGILVDPHNRLELAEAIRRAVRIPKVVPDGLSHFHFDNFMNRAHRILDGTMARP